MMTFIHDKVTVICHEVRDDALANKALHQRNIENAGRLFLPAVDDADSAGGSFQKYAEPGHPLVEKLTTMNQHQRLRPRSAIMFAATTVLPKAVVAANTPVSNLRSASKAWRC